MKSTGGRAQALSFAYRSLMVCLVTLGIIIIGGTVYGVFFNTAPARPAGNEQPPDLRGSGPEQTFTGIGRLRIPTADPQPGTVILFVSFMYYPGDRAFSEELTLRLGYLRTIIRDYIGSFTAAELQRLDEEHIRTELLRRFNGLLRLGRIETLFFSDFMII
ncbi:MAG: flagellar basal body protein FliL [Treponema sp.]|nr:flagellar basal body protein FliL [Treponema sp.]